MKKTPRFSAAPKALTMHGLEESALRGVADGKMSPKCYKYPAATPGATQCLRGMQAAPVGSVSSNWGHNDDELTDWLQLW